MLVELYSFWQKQYAKNNINFSTKRLQTNLTIIVRD